MVRLCHELFMPNWQKWRNSMSYLGNFIKKRCIPIIVTFKVARPLKDSYRVMAATIHVTLATYAGVDTRQNELSICPNLPEHWQALAFQFIHQGVTYQFSLTQTSVTITADKDTQLLVQGALIPLTAERPKEVHYQ